MIGKHIIDIRGFSLVRNLKDNSIFGRRLMLKKKKTLVAFGKIKPNNYEYV